MAFNYYCIDAGSPYCPCRLAKTDDCLICSMLQGKDTCDCRWQGICVYQEYIWAREKIEKRQLTYAPIVEKKFVSDKLFFIRLSLPLASMIRDYNQPGAFAFLRNEDLPEYYDLPLCVMDLDEQAKQMVFAVNIVGPKSKALAESRDRVLIRGPYWNGIFGLKHIKSSVNKHWLLVGRGIGQVSLILLVKNLMRGNNKITALLDPGNLKVNLAEEALKKMGVNIQDIVLNNTFYKSQFKKMLEKDTIDFLYSGGSDIQHKYINSILNKLDRKVPLIICNNHQLCCGEGVCGSCETLIDDELIHFCKIQLASEKVLGG